MEIYTCRSRDTLYSIARRFGIEAEQLAGVNRISPAQPLPEGLSLMIPSQASQSKRAAQLFVCTERPGSESLCREWSGSVSALISQAQPRSSPMLSILPVTNRRAHGSYDSAFIHQAIKDAPSRSDYTAELLEAVDTGGFGGLCLCFKYINSFDKEPFSRFMEQLSNALHLRGLYLMLAAAPRLSPDDPEPSGCGIDLAAAGSFCDYVLLQCYDWGNSGTAPQAVSPLPMISQSIDHALGLVPPSKLLLALSDHGYRWHLPWKQGDCAVAVSHDVSQALAVSNAQRIGIDRLSQSPFFNFSSAGQRCVIYYEDARSLYKKLQLLSQYSLAGAAMFCSHQPSNTFLYLMQQLFNLEKLCANV